MFVRAKNYDLSGNASILVILPLWAILPIQFAGVIRRCKFNRLTAVIIAPYNFALTLIDSDGRVTVGQQSGLRKKLFAFAPDPIPQNLYFHISYSRYWTGTSLQWRFIRGISLKRD